MYFFGTFLPLKNALKLMQIGLYSIAMICKHVQIDSALVFQSTLNPLKVLEIFHYLMETESDVKLTASVCTSRINKIIVWPEV